MNSIDDLQLIFRLLVTNTAPVSLLFAMSGFKCRRKTAWLIFTGIVAFGTVLCSLLLFMVSAERMKQVFALILAVPSLIFLIGATNDRPSQILFSFFTAINALYFSAILSHFILGGKDEPVWADALIRAAVYGLILFAFVRYLRSAYHFLAVNMKNNWRVISLIPFMFFLLVMFLGMYPHTRSDNLMAVVFLYIILGFVYFIIYQIFHSTYSLLTQQSDNDALRQQVNALTQQMDTARRSEDQVRIYRHDMRHIASNAAALLQEGKPEDALRVLESFDEHCRAAELPEYCKNITVNATLSLYFQKAADADIQVTADCDIPQKLPVDELELSMVCANAIENAIHACHKLPPDAEKSIHLRCISKPQLVLEIANTYDGHAVFDENHYPVAGEAGHGIGTRSILSFARKYHAILDYKTDEKIFRLRLLINVE